MSRYFFIKDNNEKEIEIDLKDFEEKRNKEENLIKDSFNSENEIEIYNIGTVSDKEINRRIYQHKHVLETVTDGLWIKPFNKPLLKNHDEMTEPLGRIIDSFYVTHEDKKCIASSCDSELPKEVIDILSNKNMLDKGTGSVILKIVTDEKTLTKIKNGIYLTTSQGSITDSMNCSICGKPINKCDHLPGKIYNQDKCLIVTGKLRPVENSIVNSPANDTSIFVVYNKTTKTIIDSLHIIKDKEEININDNKQKSEVEKNIMNPEKIQKMVQILKDNQIKKVKDFFGEEEKLNKVFDSFELEDLDKLIEITDTFLEFGQLKINDKITELQKIIDEKELSIVDLTNQVETLELKLTDLENIEAEVEVPVEKEEETQEIEVTQEEPEVPVVEEKVEEVPVVEVIEQKDNEEIKEEEKVEDLEEIEENVKVEKITDNFTTYKINKKEVKDNNEIVKDFFTNQKNIINTF